MNKTETTAKPYTPRVRNAGTVDAMTVMEGGLEVPTYAQPMTREQWKILWMPVSSYVAGRILSLSEYCRLCDAYDKAVWTVYPGMRTDNKRYVCHVADCLKRGLPIPAHIWASLTDHDMMFDAGAFEALVDLLPESQVPEAKKQIARWRKLQAEKTAEQAGL
jgi:hypothetical protein